MSEQIEMPTCPLESLRREDLLQARNKDLEGALSNLMDYTIGLINAHFDDPSRVEDIEPINQAKQSLAVTEELNSGACTCNVWHPIGTAIDQDYIILGSPSCVDMGVVYRRRSDNKIIGTSAMSDGSTPTSWMPSPSKPKGMVLK